MGQYDEFKQQVVDTCLKLVERGFLVGTGGNVSVRVMGQKALAITPSNYDYLKMKPEDVCILGWDLRALEGDMKPSVESGLHAAVYEKRPDVNVVIHTHQVYASVFGLINEPIPALFDEQVRFLGKSIEVVPYAMSGTGFLKRNLVSRLNNHCNAYILQNHGVVCLAATSERAIFNVELLEKCALKYLLALCTEKEITRIPRVARELVFAALRRDQAKSAQGAEQK